MKREDWIALGLTPRGRFSFATLLATLLPLEELRRAAKEGGVKPKGFRVEHATAQQLAEAIALAFVGDPKLQEVIATSLDVATTTAAPPPVAEQAKPTSGPASTSDALEIAQLRTEVQRLERSSRRAAKSRDETLSELHAARFKIHDLEAQVAALLRKDEQRAAAGSRASVDRLASKDADTTKIFSLERALEETESVDRERRLRIAELTSRIRELQAENEELEGMLPRGERERRRQLRKSHEEVERRTTMLPRFSDEFLRSVALLQGNEQRQVFVAIARLILFGPEYPGLHFKVLKGVDGVSSIRAAEGLRIYLQRSADVVDLLDCGQREQQSSWLKRRRS
ncbi:MAG TPA: hypothetical protein PKE00_00395 [Planctomycetota bacterium]|nr:hypothetical protein [Planctomycetota bacterium]